MDNSLRQKISAVERAKKLGEIKEALKNNTSLSPEELEKAYADSAYVKEVKVSVHTSSCCVCVGKIDSLKGNELTEQEREFIRGSGNCSKYEMFPVAQRKLNNILTKVHQKKESCSIAGSDLMNEKLFNNDFLPYLKKMEEELEEVKSGIEMDFDDRMEIFEREVLSIVHKLLPDREENVKSQLTYIKNRGAKGYIDRICIELKTKFDGSTLRKEDLKDFLEQMKKNATDKFAGEILYSLVEDLWQACITYAINISSSRYKDASDLTGFTSTRKNLRNEAIKVKGNALPIADKIPDVIELCDKVEKLSLFTDGFEAPDEVFDTMVAIYLTAREKYGYVLCFADKTKTGAVIPSWLKFSEIEDTAEEIIKSL